MAEKIWLLWDDDEKLREMGVRVWNALSCFRGMTRQEDD